MLVAKKLLVLAALVFMGCTVGEVPLEGGTPDAAVVDNVGETSFTTMIKPLVTECVSCHGSGTPPNLSSFTALQAKYKMKPGNANILVTKGGAANTHQGLPYLTTEEQATVTAWIESL